MRKFLPAASRLGVDYTSSATALDALPHAGVTGAPTFARAAGSTWRWCSSPSSPASWKTCLAQPPCGPCGTRLPAPRAARARSIKWVSCWCEARAALVLVCKRKGVTERTASSESDSLGLTRQSWARGVWLGSGLEGLRAVQDGNPRRPAGCGGCDIVILRTTMDAVESNTAN